ILLSRGCSKSVLDQTRYRDSHVIIVLPASNHNGYAPTAWPGSLQVDKRIYRRDSHDACELLSGNDRSDTSCIARSCCETNRYQMIFVAGEPVARLPNQRSCAPDR